MATKIYVSYSHPEDVYALDMIKGKLFCDCDKDVNLVTQNHRAKKCDKALILLSKERAAKTLVKDLRRLKMANIPVYIVKIHKHQNLVLPKEFSTVPVHEWSLDKIMEFCS